LERRFLRETGVKKVFDGRWIVIAGESVFRIDVALSAVVDETKFTELTPVFGLK